MIPLQIMVDRARLPWDGHLHELLEAVIISPRAKPAALRYAFAVHRALLRLLHVDAARLPLLYYDVDQKVHPFTEGVVEPPPEG